MLTVPPLRARQEDILGLAEHFARAVYLSPGDSAAQTNYGSFLCAQRRFEEGERRFMQALKNSLYTTPEIAYLNAGLCAKGAGALDKARADRYAGWDQDLGRRILAGDETLASLRERAMGDNEPTPTSGRQEALENLVARHIERAR